MADLEVQDVSNSCDDTNVVYMPVEEKLRFASEWTATRMLMLIVEKGLTPQQAYERVIGK